VKLADLNPTFYGAHGRGGINQLGLGFDCPACTAANRLDKCEWGGWIAVPFANPMGGEPPLANEKTLWQRTGDTFADMTLSPSVHAVGHWHGWVRNGNVETC